MGRRVDITDRTFAFAVEIVALCRELDRDAGVARTLGKQLLRAGTSVGANVEEGQAGQSRADFVSKLSVACKEARETLYWLRLVAAAGVVPTERAGALSRESDEIVAVLTAIIRNTRTNAPRPARPHSGSAVPNSLFRIRCFRFLRSAIPCHPPPFHCGE